VIFAIFCENDSSSMLRASPRRPRTTRRPIRNWASRDHSPGPSANLICRRAGPFWPHWSHRRLNSQLRTEAWPLHSLPKSLLPLLPSVQIFFLFFCPNNLRYLLFNFLLLSSVLSIGVRPEDVRLDLQPTTKAPFPVRIRWVEHHGSRSIVHADLGGTIVKATVPAQAPVAVDSFAWLGFTPSGESILDVATDSFFLRPEGNVPYERATKAIESTISG
jgi:hypothetical protein